MLSEWVQYQGKSGFFNQFSIWCFSNGKYELCRFLLRQSHVEQESPWIMHFNGNWDYMHGFASSLLNHTLLDYGRSDDHFWKPHSQLPVRWDYERIIYYWIAVDQNSFCTLQKQRMDVNNNFYCSNHWK